MAQLTHTGLQFVPTEKATLRLDQGNADLLDLQEGGASMRDLVGYKAQTKRREEVRD